MLVDGASSLAKRFGISSLVIGLTVVAFGTSAPELFLNIVANFTGSSELAIGNIIGANIANILLIGGIAAIIYPIGVSGQVTKREIPFSLLALLVLAALANDRLIDGDATSLVSRIDGIILLFFFTIFMYYTFGATKIREKDETEYKKLSVGLSLVYILLGCVGLAIGSKWVVDSASVIARTFGLSEAFIGLTIIAIGTTLPELTTSVIAATKKNADLAIGNIVGSNIFNALFIVGISATIRPLAYSTNLNSGIIISVIATMILFYFIFTGKRERSIERYEGVALVCLYLIYIAFLVWQG